MDEQRRAGPHRPQRGEQPEEIAAKFLALEDRAVDQIDRVDITRERVEAQLLGGA